MFFNLKIEVGLIFYSRILLNGRVKNNTNNIALLGKKLLA